MVATRSAALIAGLAGILAFHPTNASADEIARALRASHVRGPTDWSGFYIGGEVGGAWSTVDWTQVNRNFFNTLGPVIVGTNSGFSSSGAQGGILGGYNRQVDHWVFGLELAATATDLSDACHRHVPHRGELACDGRRAHRLCVGPLAPLRPWRLDGRKRQARADQYSWAGGFEYELG